jgi:hypothetical protein
MKVALFIFLGLLLGAIVGGTLGVAAGLIWTEVFNTTSREGQAGMLVFFGFMPIGIVVGAIGCAVWLGVQSGQGRPLQVVRGHGRRRGGRND